MQVREVPEPPGAAARSGHSRGQQEQQEHGLHGTHGYATATPPLPVPGATCARPRLSPAPPQPGAAPRSRPSRCEAGQRPLSKWRRRLLPRAPPIGRSRKAAGRDWLPAGRAALRDWAAGGGARAGRRAGSGGSRSGAAPCGAGPVRGGGNAGNAGDSGDAGNAGNAGDPGECGAMRGLRGMRGPRPLPPLPVMVAALGEGAALPPAPHGPRVSPRRELRWRVRQHGRRGAPGRLHAVPGRVRLARRRAGGEEAGRPGGVRGRERGAGAVSDGLCSLGSGAARRTSCPAPCPSCWRPSRRTRLSASATWRSRRWAPGRARPGRNRDPRPARATPPVPPQVTVVGIVRQAEKAPTNILYKVDDMTAAPMDVRQWVDTDVSVGFATNGLL